MTSRRVEHVRYLRDGEVRVRQSEAGLWVASWRPHRSDHPDYPGIRTDSDQESMPTEGGANAVLAWAVERFETRDERIIAEVSIEAEAREGEVEALKELFDESGVPSIVTASTMRASRDVLPWAMLIKAELGIFLAGLVGAAGGDAWHALKRLVLRIFETRRRPDRRDGGIRLEENGRTIILTDTIPDEGFRQLTEGELPSAGYFVWDEEQGGWQHF